MNLFGRKKPSGPAPTTGGGGSSGQSGSGTTAAIAKLRDATETLDKREAHLQYKIDNEIKQARAFSKDNKKREALTCIKRKKMYEKQLEQLSGAKITLETQRLALENININRETIEASRAAATAMSAATQQMGGVDAVEDTMDQVEEGLQDADEIGQAMSRAVNTGIDADDDDLLAELEGLEQEDLVASLVQVDDHAAAETISMPSAPISVPSAPKGKAMSEEERELFELEQSMAM